MKISANRWRYWAPSLLALIVLQTGCATTNTDRGLLTGGVLGAGVGALAAGPRNAGKGALIGGALGAAVGGVHGAARDNQERRVQESYARAQQNALTPQQIVELTASGTSDDIIINQIRSSGTVYRLTSNDLIWLQQSGVRPAVIKTMQGTTGRAAVVQPVAVRPVYVMDPGPPPPPAIGVGVSFRQ
jgi:hypothetical protein